MGIINNLYNSYKDKDEERKRQEAERKRQEAQRNYHSYAMSVGGRGSSPFPVANKLNQQRINNTVSNNLADNSFNQQANAMYKQLDDRMKGNVLPDNVKAAQDRLNTLSDQAKGLVHSYGEKFYDGSDIGQASKSVIEAQNMAKRIGEMTGTKDDGLANLLNDTKLVQSYYNGQAGKDFTDEEKLLYSKGKLNSLSPEEQKDIQSYADSYRQASRGSVSNLKTGLSVLTGASKEGMTSYEDFINNIGRNIEISKKKKAIQEKYGYDDKTLNEYLGYARRVEDAAEQERESKQFYIDPNSSSGEQFAKSVGNTAYALGTAIPRGIVSLGTRVQAANDNLGYNSNSPFNRMLNNSMEAKNQVTTNAIGNDHPVGQFFYNAGVSTAESAENILFGSGIFGAASKVATLVPFAADAYSSQYMDAKQRGLSDQEADKEGFLSGMIEAGTELVSLDHLYGIAQKKGMKFTKDMLTDIFAQAGIEGSEEFFGDILNAIVDYEVAGKSGKSQYQQNVQSYVDDGMSPENAKKQATKDFWKETLTDFLSGSLSGLAFGVGGTAISTIGTKSNLKEASSNYGKMAENIDTSTAEGKQYKEEYEKYASNPVRAIADSIDDSTAEGKQAKAEVMDIAKKEASGQKLSASDIFKLNNAREVEATPDKKYLQYVNEIASVPGEYRTAVTGINEEEARSKMNQASKDGDVETMSQVYQQMKNSRSMEVREVADEVFDMFRGQAEENGVSPESLDAAKVSSQQAYLSGYKGESIESLGNISEVARQAHNEGTQARLELKSASLEASSQMIKREDVRQAYLDNYDDKFNVAQYNAAFNSFYNAGKSRLDFDSLVEKGARYDWLADAIGKDKARTLYDIGLNQANAEAQSKEFNGVARSLNHQLKGSFTDERTDKGGGSYGMVLSYAANAFGLNIRLVDDGKIKDAKGNYVEGARADYSGSKGEIVLTTSNVSSFFHEITHFAQDFSPETYKKFKSTVLQSVSESLGAVEYTRSMRSLRERMKDYRLMK